MYRFEQMMKDVLYNVFEPVVQIRLVGHDCSFLYASGVTNKDETVLFIT